MTRPSLLLLLLPLLAAMPAVAQQVYRCQSSDGTSVFADRPCRFVDAAPIAPPQPIDEVDPATTLGRIATPFGRRLLCYADLTATGRYLHFVEAWIRQMRPFYANSHTAVSSTGR